MNSDVHLSSTPSVQESTARHPRRAFVLHYLEMLVAMGVGMMTLYPLWQLAVDGRPSGAWVHRTETDSLVMATTMVVTMALWMRFRRHDWASIVAMSLAMYAGFVVLFPFLWVGVLGADEVVTIGHVLMLVFMLAAMLVRPHDRHAR